MHQDGSFCIIDLNTMHCTCAWYLDRAICKHLVGACIQTSTNLPGLVFMPKVFVSRWRRRKPINIISPIKSMQIDEDNVAIQSPSQSHSLSNDLRSTTDTFVVTSKPKQGRPRKIGQALVVDNVVETIPEIDKRKKVKRLVQFQPRSSQRLNCKK